MQEARRGCSTQEEAATLVDMDRVIREALDRAQNDGIVFIDEIDKIACRDVRRPAPTSRATACSATCCPSSRAPPSPPSTARCSTDHVLFIAAGAFHVAKVSDLIPELQGRFPIRVELEPLTRADLARILGSRGPP